MLAEAGFAGLGVNGLARRSGSDKQLIYRYFGGIEGVLEALGGKVAERLTAALAGLAATNDSYGAMAEQVLVALLHHLRSDAQYRQLRLMEVAAPSVATEAFRQARGTALATWVGVRAQGLVRPEGCDVAAINAVLIAAVEGVAILGAAGLTHEVATREEAAIRTLVRAVYPGE